MTGTSEIGRAWGRRTTRALSRVIERRTRYATATMDAAAASSTSGLAPTMSPTTSWSRRTSAGGTTSARLGILGSRPGTVRTWIETGAGATTLTRGAAVPSWPRVARAARHRPVTWGGSGSWTGIVAGADRKSVV